MARIGRTGFLAIAVVFHLIYAYSIFDIYFVSPIVSGMKEFQVERKEGAAAPSSRLVLFVGDGLRADKAFQSFPDPSASNSSKDLTPRPMAPFLRSRVLSHGTFGVSHTRVPTESRPGHVALIAGLYEDVSAVMTGWKLNPVNFDSVFNRSRHTWSWGSPDILPMFKEGAVPGRIDAEVYGEEAEDFTQDATKLDDWVFDKVKDLFAAAKTNSTLDAALRENKVVFFLHLLGLDTTGHAYRPYSKEYLQNIQLVDRGVEEITKLIDDFYDDGRTAYVFTADHGMSDWGSHGDGHPDNTRTPLIAWGSGVAKPKTVQKGIAPGHEDGFSHDWNLDRVYRHDVSQADVAALMAYLAGLEFPVNSVGELPLPYLAAGPQEKASAVLANAKGVVEMYKVKESHKRATKLRFRPYSRFADAGESIDKRIADIEELIDTKKYEMAIQRSFGLLHLGLDGLRYLQTYDWLFLRALVTTGYLGWIAFALTTVIDMHVLHGKSTAKRSTVSTTAFLSVLVGLFSVLWVESSAWTYYAYAVFPVFFWEEVTARRQALVAGREILFDQVRTLGDYISFGTQSLIFIALLEALVQSYFTREIYTICYLFAAVWPATYGKDFVGQNLVLVTTWALGCISLSVFTLLPVIKVENAATITYGGLLMLLSGVLYLFFEKSIMAQSKSARKDVSIDRTSRNIMGLQVGLIALAIAVTNSSVQALQAKRGLPFGNQVIGWLVLVASLIIPFLHGLRPNSHYLHRLVVICLSFSPVFIILTISYEGLFYFVFCGTLITWVRLEHRIFTFNTVSKYAARHSEINPMTPALHAASTRISSLSSGSYRTLTLADARIALFFFFFLQSAFFSTGNIASVSSFSLDAVYRLIPVFDPFSQGALLLFKIMVPFAIISANLGILNRRLGVAPSALFMIVMAISDVMTLNFFYMVRDEGSWLDIGTTICHFCVASGLCVYVAGLEFLSEMLISGVYIEESDALIGQGPPSGQLTGSRSGKERRTLGINGAVDASSNKSNDTAKPNGGVTSNGKLTLRQT